MSRIPSPNPNPPSSRLRRRPLCCGSVPRVCRYTGVTLVSSFESQFRSTPAPTGPRRRQPPWLIYTTAPVDTRRPTTHRNFLLSLCPTVSIYMSHHGPPPRFAPPRPRAPDHRPHRGALVNSVPHPLLPGPPDSRQPAPARGWMRNIHAAYSDGGHTHAQVLGTPRRLFPPPIPTTPRPDRHRHQPTAPPPRRALAAPRDEPALRVGALTGPRPPVACFSLSVRPSVRRDLARGASNPAGHARHPPPACLVLRAGRGWWLVVPTLASALLYVYPGAAFA